MVIPPMALEWRDGKYSDWECRLGEETFRLHKVVLGAERRGSRFFAGAFNDGYDAAGTDLAQLLPEPCHAHIQLAIDFMYGHDCQFDTESAVPLWKIADILQIDALLPLAAEAIGQHCSADPPGCLSLAMSLQLPVETLMPILVSAHPSEIMRVLFDAPKGSAWGPGWASMVEYVACEVQGMEKVVADVPHLERLAVAKDVPNLTKAMTPDGSLCLDFSGAGAFAFGVVRGYGISECCIQVHSQKGPGPAIGVSLEAAKVSLYPGPCADGGFATREGCWGMCVNSGSLFAEGIRCGCINETCDLTGRTLRMRLDVDQGELRFLEVQESGDREMGRIPAMFKGRGPLLFTASACCSVTRFEVKQWRRPQRGQQPARGSHDICVHGTRSAWARAGRGPDSPMLGP